MFLLLFSIILHTVYLNPFKQGPHTILAVVFLKQYKMFFKAASKPKYITEVSLFLHINLLGGRWPFQNHLALTKYLWEKINSKFVSVLKLFFLNCHLPSTRPQVGNQSFWGLSVQTLKVYPLMICFQVDSLLIQRPGHSALTWMLWLEITSLMLSKCFHSVLNNMWFFVFFFFEPEAETEESVKTFRVFVSVFFYLRDFCNKSFMLSIWKRMIQIFSHFWKSRN